MIVPSLGANNSCGAGASLSESFVSNLEDTTTTGTEVKNNPSGGPVDNGDDDDNCSIIDWEEENEFTSTFHATQKNPFSVVKTTSVATTALDQKQTIPTDEAKNPMVILETNAFDKLGTKEVVTPHAPVTVEEYEEFEDYDDVSFLDVFYQEESFASVNNTIQPTESANPASGATTITTTNNNNASAISNHNRAKSRKTRKTTGFESFSCETVHTDVPVIKSVIVNWDRLFDYLQVILLMDMRQFYFPLNYIQSFYRSRKLEWITVILNSLWVSEDGFIYGNHLNNSGVFI